MIKRSIYLLCIVGLMVALGLFFVLSPNATFSRNWQDKVIELGPSQLNGKLQTLHVMKRSDREFHPYDELKYSVVLDTASQADTQYVARQLALAAPEVWF